ncbi:hypothetical protein BU16DRAFT_564053 [Lophium mytilinum]|uniref:Uncharacterized protein n=1 Tax=Lophium mytilinum TaxID=390894 RepID=A0A6A6QJW0_9PEZI|nr:hypothetical protein BU16DRAFT_564053 [Lophium mytilinum]
MSRTSELDGGLPIVRDQILVGLIPAPDLEFALDRRLQSGRQSRIKLRLTRVEVFLVWVKKKAVLM